MKELQVIQQAKSLKVLVIGDSCIDKFVYGTCDRLSPEAPVPVLKHTKTKEMPGMAGNVVENIKAFTSDVWLQTQAEHVEKIRYVDSKSNQHVLRFDVEPDCLGSEFATSSNPLALKAVSSEFDIVIISDYNKGFVSFEQANSFTEKMQQVVYVDSKKPDISCFKNSIIKLNQNEFKIAGISVDNTSTVIKTLGNRGASCNGSIYPSFPVEVFDVSGAGDTFLASFSIYHSITKDIRESIIFANKCSSLVVQRKGTYALTKKDVTN